MPLDEELAAWLRLSLVPGLTGEILRRLLAAYEEPQRILGAGRIALARLVPERLAATIAGNADAAALDAAASWLDDRANRLVPLTAPDYPRGLLQIADPPPFLYVKG